DYLRRRMVNEGASEVYALCQGHMPCRLRLGRHVLALVARNLVCWVAALWWCRGRTDVYSIELQLRAARTRSRLKYLIKTALDNGYRALVRRKDWLEHPVPRPLLSSGGPAPGSVP